MNEAEILIKNGTVYDPINGIKGERVDVALKDGKIVGPDCVDQRSATVIDAKGKAVMPGGIDLHSHIAGPKLNAGRIMRPEDHYKTFMRAIPGVRRSGSGKTTPSTSLIGYKYARMGWTTVFEPATPPLETRHTHEELDDIPLLDKGCFPLLDSNWFVLDFLQNKDYEKCAAFVAFLMDAIKGYAIKIVDPGSAEAWAKGGSIGGLDDTVPGYSISPREIIEGLHRVNQILRLPHPIHVHCNRLGYPGNYETTIQTMDTLSGSGSGDSGAQPAIHVTHCQFTGYAGWSWDTLNTGAGEIARYVNSHKHVTLDLGQVIFGDATTMTADAPFEYVLYHMMRGKWSSTDIEAEAASGIVPYKYKKKNYVNAIQFCIGLELALLIEDPWRVIPTTDHPNAGPFTKYPEMLAWLMSKKAREDILAECSKKAVKRAILPTIAREYSLYDVAITTRAAPAKLLGLKNKGSLGIGADADVAIYDLDPDTVDLSKDYVRIVKAFRRAAYTIKDGEIVVRDGEVLKHAYGKTYYVRPSVPDELLKSTMDEIRPKFKDFYSINLENYSIGIHELRRAETISVEAKVG